jgi:hypothetical protein
LTTRLGSRGRSGRSSTTGSTPAWTLPGCCKTARHQRGATTSTFLVASISRQGGCRCLWCYVKGESNTTRSRC